MAKKKKIEPIEEETLVIDSDSEDLAFFLTLLVAEVNPLIRKGPSYALLLELLIRLINEDVVTEEDAIEYGQKIKATENDAGDDASVH